MNLNDYGSFVSSLACHSERSEEYLDCLGARGKKQRCFAKPVLSEVEGLNMTIPKSSASRGMTTLRYSALEPGENSLRLPRPETDKITDIVKDSRRDQNQAVKTIQQTAVTRNKPGSVLQTKIALN